jgi:hypothetical protein
MAYTGEDLTNYQAGYEYLPQKQYSLDYTLPTSTTEEQVTQSFGIPYTGAFTGSGGGGGGASAGSSLSDIHGYDPHTSKTFTKDVWSQITPGVFGWKPTQVTGYMSPSGWKTAKGKNISHLGLNVPSIIGGIFDKNWGQTMPGDIRGLFTEGLGSGIDEIKEGTEEWFDMIKQKTGWSNYQIKKQMEKKQKKEAEDKIAKQQADVKASGADVGHYTPGASHYTRGRDQGGLGLTQAQAQSVSQANKDAGYSTFSGLAEGGLARLGYRGGQLVRPGPGRPGYKGREDPMGGFAHQTAQEMREAAPDQFGGGMNISHGGAGEGTVSHGGGDGGLSKFINTDLISTEPSMELMYSPSQLANIRARIFNKDLTSEDDINVEGDISGAIGPVDYSTQFTDQGIGNTSINYNNLSALIDANKNFNVGYNTNINDWDVDANISNLKDASLSAAKNGWGVNLTHNPEGTNVNFGWSKTLGGPEPTYDNQVLSDQERNLIYGFNNGGLVGIL